MKNIVGRIFAGLVLLGIFAIACMIPWPSTTASPTSTATPLPSFEQFVAEVSDGQAGVVRGVYVEGVFAWRVVQQPDGNPTWQANDPQLVTQIKDYSATGTVALNAHSGSYAGGSFYDLVLGQELRLVYGDGQVARYKISSIKGYQVLNQEDPTVATFTDLDTGIVIPWTTLFYTYYQGNNNVVLYTCLSHEDDGDWGRTIITALPQP